METDSDGVFDNGAKWLRADFHLHTKADKEFDYSGEDNDFCRLYVEQLVTQEVGVGVITNHNKFDKSEFKALRKKASKKGVGLFAGVEFSLKEGIHILLVFDEEWYQGETDNISQFLNQAFYSISNPATPPYPNSNFDLGQTVEALDAIGLDYFIVLAHVDDRNGLNELKGRTREAFIEQEDFKKVLAVQKSGNQSNYDELCRLAKRRVACVEGSDNAQGGIGAIGTSRISYLKIGDFNFEALKYALTDHENRLSPIKRPEVKNSYIKSVSFQGGLLDGQTINLSPELNSLIGIRGSGKSSILEIVRYTLGIPLPNMAVDPTYKDGLIKHILKSGGKTVITVVNDKKEEYRIEKIYGQKEDIYKDSELQSGISIDAIFDQPVYFGQKDLSNKDADFEGDLIQRLIGTRLKDVKSKIDTQIRSVEQAVIEIKKLSNLSEQKKDTEEIIRNSKHQLKYFKDRGVEKKLQQQTLFDSDISKLNQTIAAIKSYIEDLQSVVTEHEYFFEQKLTGSELNSDLFNEANSLLTQLKSEFSVVKSAAAKSAKIRASIEAVLSKLKEKKEGLKGEFAEMKREINTDSIDPDNFLKLNRLVETSQLKLKEFEKSESKRNELKKALSVKTTDLNNLWLEEYQLIKKEVDRINQNESKLSIEVEYKGRRDKYLLKLKEVFKGSGIRETTYQEIDTTYPDFIEIYRNTAKVDDILNETQAADFKKRFRENTAELLTYKVDNKIVINYNGKPLEQHSLGQRASALILFLLAQKESDILIIDQPEDDLDNQTIYNEVIKEIKKLKGEMQFIFATHNANIPVLGDSEKVVACSYNEKAITIQSGTIDNHDSQRSIVNIMEGGDEAFNRRKDIYGIWNIDSN